MAQCASPLVQQGPLHGGYMEVPGVPENPCYTSPKGPPFCPPQAPPCYVPPKHRSCPPEMLFCNDSENQRMIQGTYSAQPSNVHINNYYCTPDIQANIVQNSISNHQSLAQSRFNGGNDHLKPMQNHQPAANIPSECACPVNMLPKAPITEKEHVTYKGMPAYCQYLEENKNKESDEGPPPHEREVLLTSQLNVEKYCPKKPCSCIPPLLKYSEVGTSSDTRKVDNQSEVCPCDYKTTRQNDCVGDTLQSSKQEQHEAQLIASQWKQQNNSETFDCYKEQLQKQNGDCSPYFGSGEWGTQAKKRVHFASLEEQTQSKSENQTLPRSCLKQCSGYNNSELQTQSNGQYYNTGSKPEAVSTQSYKEAPMHQHCTTVSHELPQKYPEVLCYCPIEKYNKSSPEKEVLCSPENPNCKCYNYVPKRDALKEISTGTSKVCPNGKVDCTCTDSELKVVPYEQHSEPIPQPENRTVEAAVACQPMPCVCDVPPCQEQPKVGQPCYLPQQRDAFPAPEVTSAEDEDSQKMGVIGPWATGRVDWGPLSGLTGTRPVVDRYSITRYSEGEWRKHNADLLMGADNESHHAKVVDLNGRQCAAFTAADSDKKQNDNTKRLSQRAHDVHRWKVDLEHAINGMADEINMVEQQRQRLKTAMGVLRMPESIAGECLERRTARMEPDLVRDKLEEELIKEMALTGEMRDLMNRMLKQMEEQLQHDKAIKQRVEMDWSDKKEAYEIEAVNVGLRNTSPTILFKPGATRFPDGQSTPESWENHTRENLNLMEAERIRSAELRNFLESFLTDMARDLRMQADRVDTALAMRIAETDEARQRLENELLKTLRRIADTEKLIADLKQAIRNQDAAMKKAQTRLDNRLIRPRQENCRDIPQYGLVAEVKSIGESVSALKAQLQQAEESLYGLMTVRGDLEREIIVKRKTLYIDRDRCQEIRSHYPSTVALTGH